METQTIFWYDLETFGLTPNYDRIAQFAGIRTDLDLNIIDKPLVLYCKLSPDYLPTPQSCMVTHITPQECNAKGVIEAHFIARINREFSTPGTIVAGFNNIRFDDEFIRNALYRNFFDPYEREYLFGCSRWDLIDLVRATHDLRPEGINFKHKSEKGTPSIKLVNLVEDNHLIQEHAHDALSDVEATIQVAALIKKKQPKIFDYALRNRNKNEVKKLIDLINHTPILYTSPEFTSEKGYTRIVMPLVAKSNQSNTIYAFDLSEDLAPLLVANEQNLYTVPGLVKIQINKCPFISPLSMLNDENITKRLGLDKNLALEKAVALKKQSKLFHFLANVREYEFPLEKDPDLRIYQDGFTTKRDKENFRIIRETKPQDRLNLNLYFDSEKANQMLYRQVARNWPEVLNEKQKKQWDSFCASRLLSPPGANSLSYEYYMRKVDEIIGDVNVEAKDKVVIAELKKYGEELGKKLLGKEVES